MGPFPKAAQHFPSRSETKEDIGVQLEVFQCQQCDLVQLRSAPVGYYREVITAATLSSRAQATRLAEIVRFVERYELGGRRALEVGCGKGGMLNVLGAAGLVAEGLEFGDLSCCPPTSSTAPTIHRGYLGDRHLPHKSDVFFCFNYLEHQPDILTFIRDLAKSITVGGMGYITVPNLDYLIESRCLYEFVADHLVYFTEDTLRRAFEFNGFSVLETRIINNDNDILMIVRRRSPRNLSADTACLRNVSNALNTLVAAEVDAGRPVAVWGAGHRTLALLSVSGQKSIEFIVDSAPFKQGKFSPVMGTPIVSPSTLESSQVELVIVMVPGIYPQEVLQTIKSFKRKMGFEVVVLEGNSFVKK